MRIFDANAVAQALPYDQLVDVLEEAFRIEVITPARPHFPVDVPGAAAGTLLLMPAWTIGDSLGVKIVTVYPDNAKHSLAAVHAKYLLLDANTGVFRAMLDGSELTLRRTACASALASRYLSRKNSRTLLMVGTGNLAPHMIAAHAAVRPISSVRVWGRRSDAARSLVDEMHDMNFEIAAFDDLEEAIAGADIISCATLANEPLIHGDWLQPGQHLDLVGAFTPQMREADTEAVTRADVFVDTYAGATAEAGEIVQAMNQGKMRRSDIHADLAELARAAHPGRQSDSAITMFKSVGTALEDLAAAKLVAAT
jgi:ornithine cyclodeaminase